jgi:hypothetical protein
MTEEITIRVPEGWHEVTVGQYALAMMADHPYEVLCTERYHELDDESRGLLDGLMAWTADAPTDLTTEHDTPQPSVGDLAELERLSADFRGNVSAIASALGLSDGDSVSLLFSRMLHVHLTAGFLALDTPMGAEARLLLEESGLQVPNTKTTTE